MLRFLLLPAPPPLLPSCTSAGYQADPSSCSSFLHCRGPGQGHRYLCPAGTRYDPSVSNCNHASVAPPCPLDTTEEEEEEEEVWGVSPTSSFACPSPGYFPLPGSCREFWVCWEDSSGLLTARRPFRCPARYTFHPATSRCQRGAPCRPSLYYSLATGLATTLREDQLDTFFSSPLTMAEVAGRPDLLTNLATHQAHQAHQHPRPPLLTHHPYPPWLRG